MAGLSQLPAYTGECSVCVRPSCTSGRHRYSRTVSGRALWVILRPRGPRSCPSYAVSDRHHLIDPIRPTREHIAISSHGDLYAMPSLCGERRGDPRVVPGFRSPFLPGMPSSLTPGSSIIVAVQNFDIDVAFAEIRTARHSQSSRNPFHAGHAFRGFPVYTFATACPVARPPVRIRPICSATEGFYFQASNGSVSLAVAGYDYNSDWTPLLAGLSPAGMAASLAAPDLGG